MTGAVRTVRGDVAPGALGITDSHDHLFLSTPALAGEELDDARAAAAVLDDFAEAGGRTVVQWSPAGTGRRLDLLAELSDRTGVHVVAATGRHRRGLYPADAVLVALGRDELARRFVADLDRCGLVKVGTGGDALSDFERVSLLAAADAARVTGAPVGVHLEGGTGAGAALDVLAAAGVEPGRVVLGHLGRHPDPAALLAAASSGAWICLDAPSARYGTTLDGVVGQLEQLCAGGYGGRVLMGADTTTRTARGSRHDAAELLRLVRCAQERLGDGLARAVLVDNPRRAWRLSPIA